MKQKHYVETYRPAFPEKGVKVRVHKERGFSRDVLSPTMTAVFEVDCCKTNEDAIACCMEKLAGHQTQVRLLFGGRKPKPSGILELGELQDRLTSLTEQVRTIVRESRLKDDLPKQDSQRLCIMIALQELEGAINGITEDDLKSIGPNRRAS